MQVKIKGAYHEILHGGVKIIHPPPIRTHFMRNCSLNFLIWPSIVIPFRYNRLNYNRNLSPTLENGHKAFVFLEPAGIQWVLSQIQAGRGQAKKRFYRFSIFLPSKKYTKNIFIKKNCQDDMRGIRGCFYFYFFSYDPVWPVQGAWFGI